MLVRTKRHDDATRASIMLKLKKSTNALEKKDQHYEYIEDSEHARENHVDAAHDIEHEAIEAIQDHCRLEIEKEEMNCFEHIEFSLKKKFWIEWKITERQKENIETQTSL